MLQSPPLLLYYLEDVKLIVLSILELFDFSGYLEDVTLIVLSILELLSLAALLIC